LTTTPPPRRRNAEQTRQTLLAAARARFARDGYASTTVRDIADDAGVNVALISRYFTSKEGLFEACLAGAVNEIRGDAEALSRDEVAASIALRIAGSADQPRTHEALLLMLRSSGDERVDEIRRGFMRSFSEQLVTATGGPKDDRSLLRAQVVLGASLGLVLLRSSAALPPIATATGEELIGPLTDLVNALLPAPAERHHATAPDAGP
jgi:AcrR family transcriptional regulator